MDTVDVVHASGASGTLQTAPITYGPLAGAGPTYVFCTALTTGTTVADVHAAEVTPHLATVGVVRTTTNVTTTVQWLATRGA
ncbi:hypothetical protein [Murinocardiopsis flavida]|nr:hypothetical protein [Murinocardiopsis flavida]